MKVAVLFSGGKDSMYALHLAREYGWDVKCLITIKSKNTESYMFHTPNIDVTTYQAQALELPLVVQETTGEKESELEDLKQAFEKAKEYDIEAVVVGAVASEYQHERVTRVCHEASLKTFAPLWHKKQSHLLKEMVAARFDIRISAIAADGLDQTWLGRKIDDKALDELEALSHKVGLHVAGEGGEYESIVLDCPHFKKPLEVVAKPMMESEHTGVWSISEVK